MASIQLADIGADADEDFHKEQDDSASNESSVIEVNSGSYLLPLTAADAQQPRAELVESISYVVFECPLFGGDFAKQWRVCMIDEHTY